MAGNPIERERRQNEKLLRGLEASYDKTNAYMRTYARDMKSIKLLQDRGAIDSTHALYLIDAAKHRYGTGRDKALAFTRSVASDAKQQENVITVVCLIALAPILVLVLLASSCS